MTAVFKRIEDVEWEPHFMLEGAKIKWIYTYEKDGAPMAVMMISFEKGMTIPDHVHKNQPDLIYVLEGKATMFIDGQGEFPMEAGMVILIPPNTLHAMRNVEEPLLLYNVFSPAIPYRPYGEQS